MAQLFIANKNYSSWSLRPWVLMRRLGIEFEEILVPFGDGSGPSPFYRFSPTGRVPCLHDGDTLVWDSLAIVEYLAEATPAVWPADRQARAWARSAAAEMHAGFPALRDTCTMNCGVRVRIEHWPEALKQELDRLDALWTQGLTRFGGPFLAGAEFTAVDAFFAPVAFRVQTYDLPLSPEALGYARQLLELPAMQDWYRDALQETWRDPAHEAEVTQAGTLLADLRKA